MYYSLDYVYPAKSVKENETRGLSVKVRVLLTIVFVLGTLVLIQTHGHTAKAGEPVRVGAEGMTFVPVTVGPTSTPEPTSTPVSCSTIVRGKPGPRPCTNGS